MVKFKMNKHVCYFYLSTHKIEWWKFAFWGSPCSVNLGVYHFKYWPDRLLWVPIEAPLPIMSVHHLNLCLEAIFFRISGRAIKNEVKLWNGPWTNPASFHLSLSRESTKIYFTLDGFFMSGKLDREPFLSFLLSLWPYFNHRLNKI